MDRFSEDIEQAFLLAQQGCNNAHAPYSKLHVGAALKIKGQSQWVVGCNVENVSYGATLCAERTAIGQAVSRFGPFEIEALVITSTSPHGIIPPCGMCLQVLSEFRGKDFPVYLGDQKKLREKTMFSQLLPQNFSPEMLP